MSEGTVNTRIDIAVSEQGASTCVRALNQLADISAKLSPTLAKSLRGRALRLGENLAKTVENAAVAILDTVVHTTPRDTGRARANWITAVRTSRPPSSPTENTDYDGDATVAAGTDVIRNTKRQPGQVIFISNSVPYIDLLNHGRSTQAAEGFVERAIQAGVDSVKKAKGTLLK